MGLGCMDEELGFSVSGLLGRHRGELVVGDGQALEGGELCHLGREPCVGFRFSRFAFRGEVFGLGLGLRLRGG